MAEVAKKALTDLPVRTDTADDDLVHVNSEETDYQETKLNFLRGSIYKAFSNASSLTSQVDALPEGTYIGKVNSATMATTGTPANTSYYVEVQVVSANYASLRLMSYSAGGYQFFKNKVNGTWASAWTAVPTREEIDTVTNSFARDITSIAGGSSKTLTVGNSTRMLLVLLGTADVRMAVYNIFCTSQGVVTATAIKSASNITLTTGTNSITISNTTSGGTYVYVNAVIFAGSITV